MRFHFLFLTLSFLCSRNVLADGKSFSIDTLPKGAEVTLPQPVSVFVPGTTRVFLTPTDSPQTLRISPSSRSSAVLKPVKIAIFDMNSERVQHVEVQPGTPLLYNFSKLKPISVASETLGSADLGIQLLSDKPLTVKHP